MSGIILLTDPLEKGHVMQDTDLGHLNWTSDRSTTQTGLPRVIAHRGASLIAPENTLPAFQHAVEVGAGMIETDARLARDGAIALIHDAELGRTTSCTGPVGERAMGDLGDCDAGYWFMPAGAADFPFRGLGLRVPALRELFAVLDQLESPVLVNVEMKNIPGDIGFDPQDRLATALVGQIHDLEVAGRVIVSSFNPGSIERVKELDASIRTAYLCAPGADMHARAAYASARRHESLHVHESSLRGHTASDTVDMIHACGLEVNVWTVNDAGRWQELAACGVDGIITDDPGGLRRALDS
jgi:glycerophosphoryl diester phosphodiesterase